MADYERKVLEFYQLEKAYPTQWPADKNEEGSSDEEGEEKKRRMARRKSRYQALERAVGNRRSFIPGSEQSDKGGGVNLVQKDEPDPLGTTDSVVRTLRLLRLPVKEDIRLRNRFLLSSTTFQPATFLSQVHADADTRTLLNGLEVLSQSIDQKSASLKVLVENNFERFVKAKATIDNVYREMKYRGVEPPPAQAPAPPSAAAAARARGHARATSKSSFRNSVSGPPGMLMSQISSSSSLSAPAAAAAAAATDSRRKNALVKESEYGVTGIKTPLLDVVAKAEEVWGPALTGREKEEHLKTVATQLERFKEHVELSAAVADSIRRKDYESLVEEYTRARRFVDETRQLAAGLGSKKPPTDEQLYQIVLAGRVWFDVEAQITALKRDIWRRLSSPQGGKGSGGGGGGGNESGSGQGQGPQHMELISLLLELGVDENPIWVWLQSRRDLLKAKVQAVADRARVEIEVLRRRLAAHDRPSPHAVAAHLESLGRQTLDAKRAAMDDGDVVEMWDKILAFLSHMLGTAAAAAAANSQGGSGSGSGGGSGGGILAEVVDYWQAVQGFVDGKTQRSLPIGYDGESRQHHSLDPRGIAELSRGTVDVVEMMREQLHTFFAGLPPEDVSLLVSPLPPPTPAAGYASPPARDSPGASGNPLSPRDPRFNLDPGNIPPSPKLGEPWEKFAFWPPWSNSVSGVHYLAKIMGLLGAGASEMASISPVARADPQVLERLRALVGTARERCVTALCAAWNRDAESIKLVEDWQRPAAAAATTGFSSSAAAAMAPSPSADVTRMPNSFAAFEGRILAGMQKILYMAEAMTRPGAASIVLPPQSKLLQMVRSQYVTTLYKALSGMVENAEREVAAEGDQWAVGDGEGAAGALVGRNVLDASDRNVRMLLTLGNLQALRTTVVPALNSQFENAFSVKLSDESKTIKDVLNQIDVELFRSYTQPSVDRLRALAQAGIRSPDWCPPPGAKPTGARAYVYECLLALVRVHSQVSTTAPSLTAQVLSFLLEQLTREMSDALRAARPRYPLEALMQATLDVEFVAQTLTLYTTAAATELQGGIYAELDRRTDDDARARLQGELPEMRNLLKKLREASRNEFACFKKARRQPTRDGDKE